MNKANAENGLLKELQAPFHPSMIEWKPGAIAKSGDKALALAYANVRTYQTRLDEVCGTSWAVDYSPWGDRIICHLTIDGVTRSATGEPDNDSERNEIGGSVAEAMAFKRACVMWGLGRYLYNLPSVWVEYDKERKQFTEPAKAKLLGILTQHYRRTNDAGDANSHPVDGSFVDAPSDTELEVIGTWASPKDAQDWAVKVGACANEFEARNSFKKVVDAHGSKLTKENIGPVYVGYYRRQQDKLASERLPAGIGVAA